MYAPPPVEPQSYTTQRNARRWEPIPSVSYTRLWCALLLVWTLFVAGVATELASDTVNVSPLGGTCEGER